VFFATPGRPAALSAEELAPVRSVVIPSPPNAGGEVALAPLVSVFSGPPAPLPPLLVPRGLVTSLKVIPSGITPGGLGGVEAPARKSVAISPS